MRPQSFILGFAACVAAFPINPTVADSKFALRTEDTVKINHREKVNIADMDGDDLEDELDVGDDDADKWEDFQTSLKSLTYTAAQHVKSMDFQKLKGDLSELDLLLGQGALDLYSWTVEKHPSVKTFFHKLTDLVDGSKANSG
jgi:hypothetical protein